MGAGRVEQQLVLCDDTGGAAMDVIKAANDLLAFLLQIAALAAVGVRASRSDRACRLASSWALGHGATPFLQAAESAGCKTANGGHMVEAVQDVMADFMLRKADSSTREGKATPMLASP